MGEDLLIITKFEEADFDIYYSLVRKDAVMRYITGRGLTQEKALEKFNSILEVNKKEEQLGYFKLHDSCGVFIGHGKLERYGADLSQLEIGYILKEEFWGRGYGTQFCLQTLSIADKFHPELDLVGIIDPENIASKRLLQKFGFKSFFIGQEDGLPTEKLILKRHARAL